MCKTPNFIDPFNLEVNLETCSIMIDWIDESKPKWLFLVFIITDELYFPDFSTLQNFVYLFSFSFILTIIGIVAALKLSFANNLKLKLKLIPCIIFSIIGKCLFLLFQKLFH